MNSNEECDDGNLEAGDGCDETCQNEDGLSGGAIAGIVVGSLAFTSAVGAAAYWVYGRKRVVESLGSFDPTHSGK